MTSWYSQFYKPKKNGKYNDNNRDVVYIDAVEWDKYLQKVGPWCKNMWS